jgi:4-amino-4-deoxy-L-arabinose transferase-like glycosyltransferase
MQVEATWMVAFYWLLCLVREHRPRYWIYLGLSLGIGLEVKYTIAGLVAAIGLAVLLTPSLRSDLRTRYPWMAAGVVSRDDAVALCYTLPS